MLLLVINEPKALEKKELYLTALPVNDILTANTIKEAEKIITNHDDIRLCLINNMIIEDIEYNLEELRHLSCLFDGEIIVKVATDLDGIKLLKKNLINEYYLADENKDVELENLKKAFNLAHIKNRINTNFNKISESLKLVHAIV